MAISVKSVTSFLSKVSDTIRKPFSNVGTKIATGGKSVEPVGGYGSGPGTATSSPGTYTASSGTPTITLSKKTSGSARSIQQTQQQSQVSQLQTTQTTQTQGITTQQAQNQARNQYQAEYLAQQQRAKDEYRAKAGVIIPPPRKTIKERIEGYRQSTIEFFIPGEKEKREKRERETEKKERIVTELNQEVAEYNLKYMDKELDPPEYNKAVREQNEITRKINTYNYYVNTSEPSAYKQKQEDISDPIKSLGFSFARGFVSSPFTLASFGVGLVTQPGKEIKETITGFSELPARFKVTPYATIGELSGQLTGQFLIGKVGSLGKRPVYSDPYKINVITRPKGFKGTSLTKTFASGSPRVFFGNSEIPSILRVRKAPDIALKRISEIQKMQDTTATYLKKIDTQRVYNKLLEDPRLILLRRFRKQRQKELFTLPKEKPLVNYKPIGFKITLDKSVFKQSTAPIKDVFKEIAIPKPEEVTSQLQRSGQQQQLLMQPQQVKQVQSLKVIQILAPKELQVLKQKQFLVPKFMQSQSQKQIQRTDLKQIQALMQKQSFFSVLMQSQKTRQSQAFAQPQMQGLKLKEFFAQPPALAQPQAFFLALLQAQRYRQPSKLIQSQVFPKTKMSFRFRSDEGRKPKATGVYNVFSKRFGKWFQIGTAKTSREAFNIGSAYTQRTLARSFSVSGKDFIGGYVPKGYKVKQKKGKTIFIEPSKQALNLPTELSALFGYRKKMKKKGLLDF